MAAKRISVSVTPEDIAAGRRGSCYRCPIARAIRRKLGYDYHVQYLDRTAHLFLTTAPYKQSRQVCRLPTSCFAFATNFDDGKPVSPFRFVVKLPEASPRV
jgi:hypothetical protein